MHSTKVLFTSAGRRVELINCFRQDAKLLDLNLNVLAVDMNPHLSAACQSADKYWKICRCDSPDYISNLLNICRTENVDLLVPTIDNELKILARSKDLFDKIGTRVAVSELSVVNIARDKLATAQFLNLHRLPVPRTEFYEDFLISKHNWRWPVILKPSGGSCSVGLHTLQDEKDIERLPKLKGDYIAQEYHDGREYTVNFFMDIDGNFQCAVPHIRTETRAGEVSKGTTVQHEKIMNLARNFAHVLKGGKGVMCFQVIEDASGLWIIELNARFGGGFPLTHRSGARFSQWLLEEVCGRPPSYSPKWTENVTMLRYDCAVFV